ncbi:MAG TPA: GspMb/PilO family protein [Vicinamibacterales bacterium]|nr:GspMb/PilO family protein [Vicinamibacterales bacterium]
MIPLWKRILIEKRAVIIPLAIALIANIAAYALWVYPLGVKSAGAADRAAAATQSVRAAEQDLAAARALVAGKSQAEHELKTFYDDVLPADFASARRLTYATLPSLARKANVKLVQRRNDVERPDKDTRLGVLKIQTQWQGDYESLRRFIYELESDPAFVIIDDVQLAQSDPTKPLTLTLTLSTYYRLGANGD